MGGATDKGVGCVGQSVEHILAYQPALFSLHKWLQKVVDHLSVHGAFSAKMRTVAVNPTMYMTQILQILAKKYIGHIKKTGLQNHNLWFVLRI